MRSPGGARAFGCWPEPAFAVAAGSSPSDRGAGSFARVALRD